MNVSPLNVEEGARFVEIAIEVHAAGRPVRFSQGGRFPTPSPVDEGPGEVSFSNGLAYTGDEGSSGGDSFFEKGDRKDVCVLS